MLPVTETLVAESRPIEATIGVLETELGAMTAAINAREDPTEAAAEVVPFGELIRATPSLPAYTADIAERCVTMTAEILADRVGVPPSDPERQVVARALVSLWQIQFQSLRHHLSGGMTPMKVCGAVVGDVRRAAELVEGGAGAFLAGYAPGPPESSAG